MNSVLLSKRDCAELPATVADAVGTVMGYNCGRTSGELVNLLLSTAPGSIRRLTPFINNAPLAEAFCQPNLFPLPLIISGGKQMSVTRDIGVQISAWDLFANPAPLQLEDTEIGPDAFNPINVPIVLGEGSWDNFPFIQVPQYLGTPGFGTVAYERVIPILGTIFKVTWTQNDDSSALVFGREFLNIPGSQLEIARIVPQDENCRQLSFFVPFVNHQYESVARGTIYMRYFCSDYYRYFDAGDDTISTNPSLMPWYFQVIEGGAVKTSDYSWSVEAIPIPVTADVLGKFWPTFNSAIGKFEK